MDRSGTERPSVSRWRVEVLILLLAAAVRFWGLGTQDLWGDEAFSVMTALGPVRNLLGSLMTGEPHPPLYPLFLAGWLRVAGHAELATRLPSALAGLLGVAVAMALARSFAADSRQTLVAEAVAGLLVAVNPFQVWYSQEARMYAQLSTFAGLATLALLRLWRGRRGSVSLYALAVVAVSGSHYYGLFVPLAHGLAVLVAGRDGKGFFRRWLAGAGLAALLYLPWVWVARQIFFGYYAAPPGTVDLPALAVSSWVRVAAGWSLTWSHAVMVALLVTALAAYGLAVPPRAPSDRFLRVVLLAWIITPFVGGYVVSLARPLYAERYLAVMSLPVILLVARGMTWGLTSASPVPRLAVGGDPHPRPLLALRGASRGEGGQNYSEGSDLPLPAGRPAGPGEGEGEGTRSPRGRGTHRVGEGERSPSPTSPVSGLAFRIAPSRLPVAVLTLVVALGVSLFTLRNVWIGGYVKSTYNAHVADVVGLARPGDAVILDGTSQRPLWDYYRAGSWPTYPLPAKLPLDPVVTAGDLEHIATSHSGAWIFQYATRDYDPNNLIATWLSQHAYRGFDNWAVTGRLQYYRFAPDSALVQHSASLTFGSSLQLERFGWLDQPVGAGETIPIDLLWKRLPTALDDAQVGLRLVDESGFTWAQSDQPLGGDFVDPHLWPVGQQADDHHGLLVPLGTPPGTYRLLMSAYAAGQGTPLPITGEGAAIDPSGVEIATIRVASPAKSLWTAGIGGFQSVQQEVSSGLELIGWAGSSAATAGQSGYRTIFWKATADAPSANLLRFTLVDSSGQVAQERDVALATASYPPSRWSTGDVLREQYRVAISDHLAAGRYQLRVTPLRPSGPPAETIVLGGLTINPGAPPGNVPPPAHPLDALLGDRAALVGYDLPNPNVAPGSSLDLALHWKDVAPLDADYTVFVHVLNAANKVVAQQDQPPAAGQRPTSSWFPSDQVLDAYHLTLPLDLPPGTYVVEVGMYNPTGGERLPVTAGGKPAGDRVILTELTVGG